MKSKNTTGYTIRGDKLYVQGSIDGNFKRYSTGLKATSQNIKYIKKHCVSELLEYIIKKIKLK